MYEMLEKGKRGGVCQVSSNYAVANNKCMNNVDANNISSYLSYIDANSLYSIAMIMKLPYDNLEWSNDMDSVDDIMNYKDDEVGYMLEVYLHYLYKEIHDLHNEYPLAPELMCVNYNMTSDVNKMFIKYITIRNVIDDRSPTLLLTLYDKDKYVVHIRNLKYHLEKVLILTNIHRCIRFNQNEWLT